ncbi:hypothetical protein L1887_32608 [Cichorium endivia]|nr:hypothetical protein L1887_32608 [Cichorium endivia]
MNCSLQHRLIFENHIFGNKIKQSHCPNPSYPYFFLQQKYFSSKSVCFSSLLPADPMESQTLKGISALISSC